VSSIVSGNAHVPVPGIIRDGGRPASTSASSSVRFSGDRQRVALGVGAEHGEPDALRDERARQWRTKRGTEGEKSASKGVRTGEKTPRSVDV